jgi:hypothetical protein
VPQTPLPGQHQQIFSIKIQGMLFYPTTYNSSLFLPEKNVILIHEEFASNPHFYLQEAFISSSAYKSLQYSKLHKSTLFQSLMALGLPNPNALCFSSHN